MKKIIDVDFTNFKLSSMDFFYQQSTAPSRQQIDFLMQITVDSRLWTVDLNFTPTSSKATPPSL